MKQFIPYIVIAVLAFILMNRSCSDSNPGKVISSDTVVITKIEYDTIEIPKPYPVVQVDTFYQPTIVERVIENSDTLNIYSDTTTYEPEFKGFYTAKVDGTILDISLGYIDNRPDRVVYKTITNDRTITNTLAPSGLYFGVVLSNNIGGSVDYLNNRWMYGYQYVNKSHQAKVSYKLFK